MKTQHFIKEHSFKRLLENAYMMYGKYGYVTFDGHGELLEIHKLKPTPQEINTIENLIITYLDDLYLSEFEEIKSYHEDTTK